MIRADSNNVDKPMSIEEMLTIWENKVKDGKCDKCGSSNVIREEDDTVLHCIICGSRYYKLYPQRSYRYDLCLMCGCYYKAPKNNTNRGKCDCCIGLMSEDKRRIIERNDDMPSHKTNKRVRLRSKTRRHLSMRIRLNSHRIRLSSLLENR
jgi:hypothetical protein